MQAMITLALALTLLLPVARGATPDELPADQVEPLDPASSPWEELARAESELQDRLAALRAREQSRPGWETERAQLMNEQAKLASQLPSLTAELSIAELEAEILKAANDGLAPWVEQLEPGDPTPLSELHGALGLALEEASRTVSDKLDHELDTLLSQVTDDLEGAEALRALERWKLARDCTLGRVSTDRCQVPFSEQGELAFLQRIAERRAWEDDLYRIKWLRELEWTMSRRVQMVRDLADEDLIPWRLAEWDAVDSKVATLTVKCAKYYRTLGDIERALAKLPPLPDPVAAADLAMRYATLKQWVYTSNVAPSSELLCRILGSGALAHIIADLPSDEWFRQTAGLQGETCAPRIDLAMDLPGVERAWMEARLTVSREDPVCLAGPRGPGWAIDGQPTRLSEACVWLTPTLHVLSYSTTAVQGVDPNDSAGELVVQLSSTIDPQPGSRLAAYVDGNHISVKSLEQAPAEVQMITWIGQPPAPILLDRAWTGPAPARPRLAVGFGFGAGSHFAHAVVVRHLYLGLEPFQGHRLRASVSIERLSASWPFYIDDSRTGSNALDRIVVSGCGEPMEDDTLALGICTGAHATPTVGAGPLMGADLRVGDGRWGLDISTGVYWTPGAPMGPVGVTMRLSPFWRVGIPQ